MSNKKFTTICRIMTIMMILGSMFLQSSGVITALTQCLVTGVSLCLLGLLMVLENRHSRRANAKMDIIVGLVLAAMGFYLIAQIMLIQAQMA